MTNEELLLEFELTTIAYAVNADNKEMDLSNLEEYLQKLKIEILRRMK